MNSQLFSSIKTAMQKLGYFHVTLEKRTGRLVAEYAPNSEVQLQHADPEYRSQHSVNLGRFQYFALVVENWDATECEAWVIRDPEGARSPSKIYTDRIVQSFLGGSARNIANVGETALCAHFY